MTTNDYPFLRRYLHKAVDNVLAMNSIWQQDNKDLYREIQGHTPLSTGWDYQQTIQWLTTHNMNITPQPNGFILCPTDYVAVGFKHTTPIKAMDDAIMYALNYLQLEWYKKQMR